MHKYLLVVLVISNIFGGIFEGPVDAEHKALRIPKILARQLIRNIQLYNQ